MTSISIPLQITKDGLLMEEDVRKSVDKSISLLIQTSCYSWVADPQYGFVLKNLRFEIFNENEGTVYDSNDKINTRRYNRPIYKMKVTGTSKNISTFAADLKKAIETYEHRLKNVTATLTYIREERRIYVLVKGFLTELQEDYQYETIIKIWN